MTGNGILKVGLISDIHLGPDRETRRGTEASRLVEVFLEDMRVFAPSFIVDLGDRIMEVAAPDDRRHSLLVRDLLGRAGVPVFHLIGNHDVAHLSKIEVCRLLGLPGPYGSMQSEGYHCLFLDSADPVVGEYGGHISNEQIAWVKAELARVHKPAIVFCHHPLDDQPIERNPLFQAHPEWAAVDNRCNVLEVLAGAHRVVAVVSGHVHWNRATSIEGMSFLTIQGLVETWTTGGAPAGAYGKLWIGPGSRLRLVVEGRDRFVVEMESPWLGTVRP